jgi:hypothetical protein
MLLSLFSTLDSHPWIYSAIAWPATLALVVWALAPLIRPETRPCSLWCSALVIGSMLLAWRWPWLLAATEFNPDESQLIAGAMALARDPIFWRSVDGTTSGPLNFYALAPLGWLGLPLDYFTERAIGLLMVAGGCTALYRAVALVHSEVCARLGTLPVIVFFALSLDPDFIHYSSEHVTLLLAPVSLWLIVRTTQGCAGGAWNLRAAAFAAGAIPWAKMQGVPVALVLLLTIAWIAWRSAFDLRRRISALAAVTAAGGAAFAAHRRHRGVRRRIRDDVAPLLRSECDLRRCRE